MTYHKQSLSSAQQLAIRAAINNFMPLSGTGESTQSEWDYKPITPNQLIGHIKDICGAKGIPVPSHKMICKQMLSWGFQKIVTYEWKRPIQEQEGE